MTTEAQDQQSPIPISFRSRVFLALAPWCVFTGLIVFSAVEGSLSMLLRLFAVTSAVGAPVMQLLYKTHRALGENLAALASILFYAGLTFLVLRSPRRWLVYLFFLGLLGSVLFSTGAFVLVHFYKQ